MSQLLNEIWYGRHPLKWLLKPASLLFRVAAGLRRNLYASGRLRAVELGVPVVVVGNLSVGGTGKTPCVIWLAGELASRGLTVGIVTRGYGGTHRAWPALVGADSSPRAFGDEAVLLAKKTGCAVAAGPDRVAGAKLLLVDGPVDVILSDDGLQHYRLARAFEIAVVDGLRGLGNGLCLPAGPLREPPERLDHVDAVVVNSGPFRLAGALRAELVPSSVYNLESGERRSLADFRERAVHAVAGIGHPDRFFAALRAEGLKVDARPREDHAVLEAQDLEFGDTLPVMITEKDAVKCAAFADDRIWCVVAELAFDAGDAERLLRSLMRCLDIGEWTH